MSLKYGLLGLLNYGSMTGYELDKAFKDSLAFFWQGQTSQIYRELNAMEAAGLVTSRIEIQTERPNKKYYTITASGRRDFLNWLSQAEENMETTLHLRSSFLMRLFFAGELEPGQIEAMLRTFRDRCRKALADMTEIPEYIEQYKAAIDKPERSAYWQMVALCGKTYYEAMEQWADAMLSDLEKNRGEKK
jgi:DNA-binding PadR family transcriptional regulator